MTRGQTDELKPVEAAAVAFVSERLDKAEEELAGLKTVQSAAWDLEQQVAVGFDKEKFVAEIARHYGLIPDEVKSFETVLEWSPRAGRILVEDYASKSSSSKPIEEAWQGAIAAKDAEVAYDASRRRLHGKVEDVQRIEETLHYVKFSLDEESADSNKWSAVAKQRRAMRTLERSEPWKVLRDRYEGSSKKLAKAIGARFRRPEQAGHRFRFYAEEHGYQRAFGELLGQPNTFGDLHREGADHVYWVLAKRRELSAVRKDHDALKVVEKNRVLEMHGMGLEGIVGIRRDLTERPDFEWESLGKVRAKADALAAPESVASKVSGGYLDSKGAARALRTAVKEDGFEHVSQVLSANPTSFGELVDDGSHVRGAHKEIRSAVDRYQWARAYEETRHVGGPKLLQAAQRSMGSSEVAKRVEGVRAAIVVGDGRAQRGALRRLKRAVEAAGRFPVHTTALMMPPASRNLIKLAKGPWAKMRL